MKPNLLLSDCCRNSPIGIGISPRDAGLKHAVHNVHNRWQKYGIALKKVSPYTPTIATTYYVSKDVHDAVVSVVPVELLKLETPTVWYLEVDGGLVEDGPVLIPPHVDDFRLCTLNFYLEASGEVTAFHHYAVNSIEEIGSFSAESGQCWILDTTIPHSVKMVPGKKRQVLGISFLKTPYKVVSSYLPQ